MTTETVPKKLRNAAKVYEERNKLYKDNYKRHGDVMEALFPVGIALNDPDTHNRFAVFTQIVAKVTRIAANFEQGGHSDSNMDLSVYAQMLDELDDDSSR
jgi:hypothetical protein